MYDTHICKKICDMLCSILLPYYNRLVYIFYPFLFIRNILDTSKYSLLRKQLICFYQFQSSEYGQTQCFIKSLLFSCDGWNSIKDEKSGLKVFPIQKEILNNVIWISPFKRRSLTPSIQEWLQWVKYFYETIPGCEIVFWRALRTDTLLDSLKCNFHKKKLFLFNFPFTYSTTPRWSWKRVQLILSNIQPVSHHKKTLNLCLITKKYLFLSSDSLF